MLPKSSLRLWLTKPASTLSPPLLSLRPISSAQFLPPRRIPKPPDESSWASAQHKPSLGNASLGHLVSELSATKPGMEALRREGQTMSEEDRATARGVAKWVMGLPVVIGTGIVGWRVCGMWREGEVEGEGKEG